MQFGKYPFAQKGKIVGFWFIHIVIVSYLWFYTLNLGITSWYAKMIFLCNVGGILDIIEFRFYILVELIFG